MEVNWVCHLVPVSTMNHANTVEWDELDYSHVKPRMPTSEITVIYSGQHVTNMSLSSKGILTIYSSKHCHRFVNELALI